MNQINRSKISKILPKMPQFRFIFVKNFLWKNVFVENTFHKDQIQRKYVYTTVIEVNV